MSGVKIVTVAVVPDGPDAGLHLVTDLPSDEAAALLLQAVDCIADLMEAQEAERRRN